VGVGFFAVLPMASPACSLSRSALRARDALVLEHLPLADSIASAAARRLFPLVEREDLIQVAREGPCALRSPLQVHRTPPGMASWIPAAMVRSRCSSNIYPADCTTTACHHPGALHRDLLLLQAPFTPRATAVRFN
jgi:hypothetical protein